MGILFIAAIDETVGIYRILSIYMPVIETKAVATWAFFGSLRNGLFYFFNGNMPFHENKQ